MGNNKQRKLIIILCLIGIFLIIGFISYRYWAWTGTVTQLVAPYVIPEQDVQLIGYSPQNTLISIRLFLCAIPILFFSLFIMLIMNNPQITRRLERTIYKLKESNRFLSESEIKDDYSIDLVTDLETGEDVHLNLKDRARSTLIIGPPGSGKTTRMLSRLAYQELKKIKEGKKLGITIIEPKGDFCETVKRMCEDMDIPCFYVNPNDLENTAKINPLDGPSAADTAEVIREVFKTLFANQDEFFSNTQQAAVRNTTLMLKELHLNGYLEELTLNDILACLTDTTKTRNYYKKYKAMIGHNPKNYQKNLCYYFENDFLGERMEKEIFKFNAGLRTEMFDLLINERTETILNGKSSFDLDEHIEKGGSVVLINTATDTLRGLSGTFGQVIINILSSAIFRRKGNETTRIPHSIYIDEVGRYINNSFEELLSMGRSYRALITLAVQTPGQLESGGSRKLAGASFRKVVSSNVANKVVFAMPGEPEEAKLIAESFGKPLGKKYSTTYQRTEDMSFPFIDGRLMEQEDQEIPRFTYTDIMEIPKGQVIYQISLNEQMQPARRGYAESIFPIWEKERELIIKEKEKHLKIANLKNKLIGGLFKELNSIPKGEFWLKTPQPIVLTDKQIEEKEKNGNLDEEVIKLSLPSLEDIFYGKIESSNLIESNKENNNVQPNLDSEVLEDLGTIKITEDIEFTENQIEEDFKNMEATSISIDEKSKSEISNIKNIFAGLENISSPTKWPEEKQPINDTAKTQTEPKKKILAGYEVTFIEDIE